MFGQLDKVYREYQMEDRLDWLNRHHWIQARLNWM